MSSFLFHFRSIHESQHCPRKFKQVLPTFFFACVFPCFIQAYCLKYRTSPLFRRLLFSPLPSPYLIAIYKVVVYDKINLILSSAFSIFEIPFQPVRVLASNSWIHVRNAGQIARMIQAFCCFKRTPIIPTATKLFPINSVSCAPGRSRGVKFHEC